MQARPSRWIGRGPHGSGFMALRGQNRTPATRGPLWWQQSGGSAVATGRRYEAAGRAGENASSVMTIIHQKRLHVNPRAGVSVIVLQGWYRRACHIGHQAECPDASALSLQNYSLSDKDLESHGEIRA